MNRVDFYVLSDESPEARARFACRLAEKAYDQGMRAFIQTASVAEAQRLDELLWTFNDRTFLPHEVATPSGPSHPRVMVLVGEGPAPAEYRQLLINLTDALPADADNCPRIAEIVDADSEHKRAARERFKQYRERGWAMESHNV